MVLRLVGRLTKAPACPACLECLPRFPWTSNGSLLPTPSRLHTSVLVIVGGSWDLPSRLSTGLSWLMFIPFAACCESEAKEKKLCKCRDQARYRQSPLAVVAVMQSGPKEPFLHVSANVTQYNQQLAHRRFERPLPACLTFSVFRYRAAIAVTGSRSSLLPRPPLPLLSRMAESTECRVKHVAASGIRRPRSTDPHSPRTICRQSCDSAAWERKRARIRNTERKKGPIFSV